MACSTARQASCAPTSAAPDGTHVGEFELIERYFAHLGARREDVVLGIGDDAALLRVPTGHEVVACVDTLVDGHHFPHESHADDIGWRALAVNLSDIAAMGAKPLFATLALTLPEADEDWLERSSAATRPRAR